MSQPAHRAFQLHCELSTFEKAGDEHPMRIGGVCTTDKLDKQDEEVVQSGLDFRPFLQSGWYNDNHGAKTSDVLGYPTNAKYVRKGQLLPNGKRAKRAGWWTEGYLLNTEEGRKTWDLCNALEGSPRKLGFSIEGSVGQRDPINKRRILRATVKNVAITHCPVNTDTEMHALAKALTAGSAINDPGAAPGGGFALRPESMDKTEPPFGQEGSNQNAWIDGATAEQDPEQTENLNPSDGDDPNNGGWAGINPHTTAIREPADGLPPGHIVKADASDFKIMDEVSLMEEWTPTMRRRMAEAAAPARVSKSEARSIVSAILPHLNPTQIDQLIDSAMTTRV